MKLNLLTLLFIVFVCTILGATASYFGTKEKYDKLEKTYKSDIQLKYIDGYSIGQWDGFSATVEYLTKTNQLKDTSNVSVELTEFLPLLKKYDNIRHINDNLYKFRETIITIPKKDNIKLNLN